MAIIITPSKSLNEELDLKYATPDDTLQVISIDNGVVTVGFPSAQPYPPPYSCKSLVNTRGVTDLSNAWAGCTSITEFPKLEFASCVNFEGAWEGCTSLTTFPAQVFDNCNCSNYANAWVDCSLSRSSVDNILVSIDRSGVVNGVVDITGGGNKGPSSTGRAARANLRAKGWVVNTECDRPPYNCNTDVDTFCVTDFSFAWFVCNNLVSFPLIDVSKGVNFGYTWCYCLSLTSFPALDFSKGENFFQTWAACFNLTTFPEIDTSSGTYFGQTWADCRSLTSFPLLNINNGTYFGQTWQGCTSLTTFPAGMFDNSIATNFYLTWDNCALSQQSVDNILVSIDKAGQLNGFLNIDGGTSSTPSLVGWYAVASLQAKGWTVSVNGTPPDAWPPTNCNTNVQTYGVTSFLSAWLFCSNLVTFPHMDTRNVSDFTVSWMGCTSLTAFPKIDTSSGSIFDRTWCNCEGLLSFPQINTSNGTYFYGAWIGCSNLTSFPLLDFSKGEYFGNTWFLCSRLSQFPAGVFDNCLATGFGGAWYGCALSQQSVDNILTSIDTAGRLNGILDINGGTSSPPGPAGLTAKANLVAKGWTVTTNAPTYVTTNLVLYLDAANPSSYPGTGTTWSDLSGGGYVGTLNGGVTYDSANGGSLVFNGSTAYVLTNYTQTNVTQYTISVWFKGANFGGGLVSNRGVDVGTGKGFCILLGYSPFFSRLYYGVNSDFSLVGTQQNDTNSLTTLNNGSWHNVTGVFNGTSGVVMTGAECSLYVDGQLVQSSPYIAFNSQTPPLSGAQGTYIGSGMPFNGALYSGKIANVMIYTRALTSQEVAQNYTAFSPRFA